MKTGPLTKADFLKLWTSAMDSGYTRPLVEGGLGSGYEVWDQAFDQGAALSQEIDTGTQGLYTNPSSSQSDIPATGGIDAKRVDIANDCRDDGRNKCHGV